MDYQFSRHAFLASFSPYYLLFGRHPVLPQAIQADADTVLANMDNPDTSVSPWGLCLFAADNPNYLGCDSRANYPASA
jgi:hypothetical protein